jgi:hypothetical protein
MLVRDQLVSEEELFQALLRQESEKRLLGEILVADSRLTPDQLRHALEAQAEETVYEVFLWPDGRFDFEETVVKAEAAVKIDMEPGFVVREGLHRLKQWRELRVRLPPSATFRVHREGYEVQDPVDQQLLGLAAAGKTLASISLETRRSEFDTTLRLHALLQRGALVLGPDQPERTPLDPVGAIQSLLARADKLLAEQAFDAALQAYEAVLAIDRLNQEAKKGLVAVTQVRRRWKTISRIPLDSVPVLRIASMALTQMQFEPEEGFVLSRINGQWSLRAILKLCPMAEADALAIIGRLVERGVVELANSTAPKRS